MTLEKQLQTLIYKQTHSGDPDPSTGVFGNNDCMKTVRGRSYDAIIGIGGKGRQAIRSGIARKLTWVGIGPNKSGDQRCPLVTFDHFLYFEEQGPLLDEVAPVLAKLMYGKNIRVIRDSLSPEERFDVEKILDRARDAPPSPGRRHGIPCQESPKTTGKSGTSSCRGKSVAYKAEQENSVNAQNRRC